MDYRNEPDFTDRNTVIYGHNMNNGTMFADFHKYIDQEYYDAHPTMLLLTPDGDYRVEFFSGYISTLDTNAWQREFYSEEEYSDWLETAVDCSAFESEVVPTVEDRVITISTCSDSAAKTRFVLLGVLRQEARPE
jgi:sortase B